MTFNFYFFIHILLLLGFLILEGKIRQKHGVRTLEWEPERSQMLLLL